MLFSSRSLERVRFQFTHPRGVRLNVRQRGKGLGAFQFTHPRGVRPETSRKPSSPPRFQFTHPRGVRHVIILDESSLFKFQFTHPRGVRLPDLRTVPPEMPFQFTHPRGVRLSREESVPMRRWFQFTHPRGVRRASSLAICTLRSTFQFTHPRGVRQQLVTEGSPGSVVSIHAPTRGATHRRSRAGHSPGCFNSRTREGCDCRSGETAVGLPLQTCFSEGTQIIPSIRCREHINPYNRMSMSA